MRLQVRYFVVGTIFWFAIGLVALSQWVTVNHDYFAKRNISYVSITDLRGENIAALTVNLYNAFPNEK